jgi:hypothetical protein
MSAAPAWLEPFLGCNVVADLDGGYLVIGRLEQADGGGLAFAEADLHDHNEANCSKDVYAIECRQLGVRSNRHRVAVPLHRLIAISRLEDVHP